MASITKYLRKTLKFIDKYLLIIVLVIYLLATLSALLDPNHFLYNLEPYPDGLLYALSGENFLMGKGFKLISSFGQLDNWVPPMYSFVLGLGAMFFSIPTSFYLTNILISLLSLSIFYWILKTTTKNSIAKILGMLVLLSHSILFWLPSSPLTENISLLFFMILIASFFLKDWKKYLALGISVVGLLLTRYSIFPLIIGGILISLFTFFKKATPRKKIITSFFILALLTFVFWFISFQNVSVVGIADAILNNQGPYFGTRFIFPHLLTYFKMLLFSQGLFLWFNIGLSNIIFFGLFLTSIIVLWRKKEKQKVLILSLLFLAQFPLQLVFYIADARYLIYNIPLIALGVVWLIDVFPERKRLLIPIVVLGIFLQLFLQKDLVRQVIADNLLGRSTAWQYEAVKHFDSVLEDGDLLITALPPFLVDSYQEKSYRTLPLSYTQEFMNKKQYVWGNDIDYEDLQSTYEQWVEEGKVVYISNSYITHLQSVIKDFEVFKEKFNLELISKGCEQACNLYQLKIKSP